MNFLEKIFSIKNNNEKTHKIITFAGLKLKVKRKEKIQKITLCGDVKKKKLFYENIVNAIIRDVVPVEIYIKPKEEKILFENYTNTCSKLDPMGTILIKDNKIYRGIYKEKCNYFLELWQKGIIQSLIKHNIIVETGITDFYTDEFPIILETKKLSMVSPHFWSYSMLKDTAINTSILLKVLNYYGYTLCDGHSGNTRFDNNKAKWIDLGSITELKKSGAIDEVITGQLVQLCMLSLSKKYYFGHRLYRESNNTLCSDISFIRSIEYENIISNFLRNCNIKAKKIAKKLLKKRKLEPEYIETLFNYKNNVTIWSNYTTWDNESLDNVSENNRYLKTIELIKKYASDVKSCIDLAGNSGYFSVLLRKNTNIENLISADYDEDAVEYGISHCKKNNINVNLALFNFMIPTETHALNDLKSDIAIALAVTHHLILTQGYNINSIFDMITKYTSKYALIEFCPLGMYCGGDILPQVPDWYTQEWFEENLKKVFDIKEVKITNKVIIQGKEYAHRIAYMCELKRYN